jgi:hypothetical protein
LLKSRLNFGLGPLTLTVNQDKDRPRKRKPPDKRTTEKIPAVSPQEATAGEKIRTYEHIVENRGVRRIIIEVPYPDYPGLSAQEQRKLDRAMQDIQAVFQGARNRLTR